MKKEMTREYGIWKLKSERGTEMGGIKKEADKLECKAQEGE